MAGRGTKFEPDMVEMARQWRRDGGTLQQIAQNLGIHIDTLHEWRKKHTDFSDALRESTDYVNATVENAMLKRARGFTYTEVSQEYENIDGRMVKVKSKRIRKRVLGDVDAQKFWLTNRQPAKWKSKIADDLPEDENTDNIASLSDVIRASREAAQQEQAPEVPDAAD